jgi:hypothetical protein
MRNHFVKMAIVVVACGLSGCGGSSGGDSFKSLLSDRSAQFEDVENSAYYPASSLPFSGSASYQGYVFAGTRVNGENAISDAVIGELTISADFSSQTISGSATNFRSDGNAALDGTLTVQTTGIDRSNFSPAFTAAMYGDLTQRDGGVRQINSTLAGNFFGTNSNVVNGNVSGNYTLNGTSRPFDGDFVGVEQ